MVIFDFEEENEDGENSSLEFTESAIAINLAWTLTHHKPSHFAIFVFCIFRDSRFDPVWNIVRWFVC